MASFPLTSSPMRLALAGMGRIAEIQREALCGLKGFLWVAACDPDASRADNCPAPVEFFASLTEMLAQTACDAVLISTPTDTHFELATQVIAAGRHVLLEKPAAVNPGEVGKLKEQARQAGVLFQTALHMSRGSETDWLVAHLAGQNPLPSATGICGFECTFHDPLFCDGTLHPRAPSVLGSWVDSGINALSVLARFVSPDSLSVADAWFQRVPDLPVRDVASRVTFEGPGIKGAIRTDWTADSQEKTTVLHFTDGRRWCLDHNKETATLTGPVSAVQHCGRHPVRMVDHYLGVLADFSEALATGKSNAGLSTNLHRLLLEAPQAGEEPSP